MLAYDRTMPESGRTVCVTWRSRLSLTLGPFVSTRPSALPMSTVDLDGPYGYRAFGLSVTSDVALPGFVPSDTGCSMPDVRIRREPISLTRLEEVNDSGDHVGTAPPGVLRALVEEGAHLTVDPDPDADADFVGAVITGELFAALLRQRGYLVLHGSAVARDGRAIGFLGHSGWGKSTLAAALVGRGWHLLTDDLLVVGGVEGRDGPSPEAFVVPGHPAMRLAPEAVARVSTAGGATAGAAAHAFTTKLQTDWQTAFHDAPVPLAHLFVLDPTPAEDPVATPVPPHLAVLEMAHHTRVRRLLASPTYRQAHLAQCAALVRTVPIAHLRRRFGLEHLDGLCAYVEQAAAPLRARDA